MFSYNIAKSYDTSAFVRTCSLVETNLQDYKKERLIKDVDGTTIQIYESNGKKIKVYNDVEVGAVYVDSELNLNSFIKSIS